MKKAVFLVSAIILTALCSCTGRTMENMEPSGDTVEVTIPEASSQVGITDTIYDNQPD